MLSPRLAGFADKGIDPIARAVRLRPSLWLGRAYGSQERGLRPGGVNRPYLKSLEVS
jgi:hypothetical protein